MSTYFNIKTDTNNNGFPVQESFNPLKRKTSGEEEQQNKVARIATETIASSNDVGNREVASQFSFQAERITNEVIKRNPKILLGRVKSELENDIKNTLVFINSNKSSQTGYVKQDSPFPILFQGTKAFFIPSKNIFSSKGKFKTFNTGIEIDNGSENFIAFLMINDAKRFLTTRELNSFNIPNRQNVISNPKYEYYLEEKNMLIQIQDLYDGDIHNLAQKENWDFLQKIKIMQEAAKGIAELHSNGYLHRDIKPDQFFKKDDKIVLADLDSVIEENNASNPKYLSSHLAGTIGFVPIDGYTKGPSKSVDMFAFGKSMESFFTDIVEKKEKNASEKELSMLIEDLINDEPKNRPNVTAAVERLNNIASIITA